MAATYKFEDIDLSKLRPRCVAPPSDIPAFLPWGLAYHLLLPFCDHIAVPAQLRADTATPTWDTYLEGSYQLVDPRAWDVLESDDRSDRVYMDFLDHHMGLVQNKAEVMSEWVHIAERRFTRHCRIYGGFLDSILFSDGSSSYPPAPQLCASLVKPSYTRACRSVQTLIHARSSRVSRRRGRVSQSAFQHPCIPVRQGRHATHRKTPTD